MIGGRQCALVVPVGTGALEMERAAAMLRSCWTCEPRITHCVLVDDALEDRGLAEAIEAPPTCQVHCLSNPRRGTGLGITGGLCCGVLAGLAWVAAHTDISFALKIDTDALAIGPFCAEIERCLRSHAQAGLLGTIGDSCNPLFGGREKLRQESKLQQALRLLPHPQRAAPDALGRVPLGSGGFVSAEEWRSFVAVRPHILQAVANGYQRLEYCQGGVFAVSRTMLTRMADAGYFERPEMWALWPSGDDVILGMYARAVGCTIVDGSAAGGPIASQCAGLPFEPPELIARGHRLIHSIRNHARLSEAALRAWFAGRRPGRTRAASTRFCKLSV